MSEYNQAEFSELQHQLSSTGVVVHLSELQGFLTGLICGGFQYESDDYLTLISDFFHNGEPLPKAAKTLIQQVYGQSWQQLLNSEFTFQPLLPEDDEPLEERSVALSVWVQGFNLGFGIQNKNTQNIQKSKLPDDVQEVLQDFAEIANLSTDVDESEENEQAIYELQEYIRMSALLCFSELAQLPEQKSNTETLH